MVYITKKSSILNIYKKRIYFISILHYDMFLDTTCYACLNDEKNDLIDIHKNDIDRMSYEHKLRTCLSTKLEEATKMKMCLKCVKHLRISYDFINMIRKTQETIKQYFTEEKCKSINHEEDADDGEKDLDLKDDLYENDNSDFLFKLETDVESFNCNKCNKQNMSSSEYVEHVCEVKEEFIIKYEALTDEQFTNLPRKKIVQKYRKKFKSKSAQNDTGSDVYECDLCDSSFSKQLQLTKHMTRIHNMEKKFCCSYCDKAFKQLYHLREHLTMHTGERNYACPICDKTFLRASSQRRHIKAHGAAPGQKTKRTPFLCTICGKSFPYSNGVQRHMRIHFGIKRHECHICKRKFMQSTHLYVHMRTHTGEKPYICDTCGEAFSFNCSLQKHMNTHNKSPRVKVEYLNDTQSVNIDEDD